MEDKEIKQSNNTKQLVLTILGVITLVIAVVGASFAVWNYVFNGQLTNTISTNDISLDLLESNTNIISIENALPMGCTQGKQQAQTFDFAVTSKTTKNTDIEYTVSIQKLEVDTGYTALQDNQIAVYLTDYSGTDELLPSNYECPTSSTSGGGSASPKSNPVDEYKNLKPMLLANTDTTHISLVSQLDNYKLYTGKHSHDSTHETVQEKFKLRAWIAGDVDASSWTSSTKLQYKFKIGLTSEEKEPSAYPEYVYRYGTNGVSIGTSLESVTGTKWIITDGNQEAPVGPYETQSECQTALEGFGSPTGYSCQEKTGTFGGFDYTEDYTTLNKTYFLGHKIGNDGTVERNDACFIRNNTLYCLKGVETANAGYNSSNPAPYYQENYNTLLEAFGPNAVENNVCSVNEGYINCSASGLGARAGMYGDVGAYVGSAECGASDDGNSGCDE